MDRVNQFQRMLEEMLVKINPNCGTVVDKKTSGTKERHGVFIDMLEWGYQRKKIKDKKADQDTEPEKDGFWDHFSDALGAILSVIYKKDMVQHKTILRRNKNNKPTDPWFAETKTNTSKSKGRSKYRKISKPFL